MLVVKYVVTLDIPGIKGFVFGTEPLREIRGASSLLTDVNRSLIQWLNEGGSGTLVWESVFSSGGSAQFLVEGGSRDDVQRGCEYASRMTRQLSAGEASLIFGIACLDHFTPTESAYVQAVAHAQWQMRQVRELDSRHCAVLTLPLVRECASTSHSPAQHLVSAPGTNGNNARRMSLSTASLRKSARSKPATDGTVRAASAWQNYISRLRKTHGSKWPSSARASKLHCRDFNEIAGDDRGRSRLGLVYADGNAMGKLIPQIDSPAAFKTFSTIVDRSIQAACYDALDMVCRSEVESILASDLQRIPADILLLGGDDLVVALPARRAMSFAEHACTRFAEITRTKIAELDKRDPARICFDRLGVTHFTISCGVAMASSSYPFGLLLELAESLLTHAKQRGSQSQAGGEYQSPSMIDFQSITSSSSHELSRVRREQYFDDFGNNIAGNVCRTLRPCSIEQIQVLRHSIRSIQQLDKPIPRGKLKAMVQAALEPRAFRARLLSRELFTRLTSMQQRTLVTILQRFDDAPNYDIGHYPFIKIDEREYCVLPDLIEAYDLYPPDHDIAEPSIENRKEVAR